MDLDLSELWASASTVDGDGDDGGGAAFRAEADAGAGLGAAEERYECEAAGCDLNPETDPVDDTKPLRLVPKGNVGHKHLCYYDMIIMKKLKPELHAKGSAGVTVLPLRVFLCSLFPAALVFGAV